MRILVLLFGLFIIFNCCNKFTIKPDPQGVPSAMKSNIYTLDMTCNDRYQIGTIGCVFQRGDSTEGKEIVFHTVGTGTIYLYDSASNLDVNMPYNGKTKIQFSQYFGPTFDKSSIIIAKAFPKYPNQNDSEVAIEGIQGKVLIKVIDKAMPTVVAVESGKVFTNGIATLFKRELTSPAPSEVSKIYIETAGSKEGTLIASGCGQPITKEYTDFKPIVLTSEEIIGKTYTMKNSCSLHGFLLPKDMPEDLAFVVWFEIFSKDYKKLGVVISRRSDKKLRLLGANPVFATIINKEEMENTNDVSFKPSEFDIIKQFTATRSIVVTLRNGEIEEIIP